MVTQELNSVKSNFNTLIKSSRKALAENEALKTQQLNTSAELQLVKEQHNETTCALAVAQESLKNTENSLQSVSEQLKEAKQRNEDDTVMVSKLQEQGIGHVKKLNAQYSQMKEYEKEIKILQNKLQTAEIDIWKDKEKITELQLELREQSNAYIKDKTAHRETVTTAHNQLVHKVKEVETLNATILEMKNSLQEKDSAIKNIVVNKDDEIRELKRQVENLERSNTENAKSSQDKFESREMHWRNEVERLQKLNEFDSSRIKKLENERSNLSQFKREMDTIKARNLELEDKIKRQEQYMKNRLLKDRGNIMSAPEGSSKPKLMSSSHSRAIHNNVM